MSYLKYLKNLLENQRQRIWQKGIEIQMSVETIEKVSKKYHELKDAPPEGETSKQMSKAWRKRQSEIERLKELVTHWNNTLMKLYRELSVEQEKFFFVQAKIKENTLWGRFVAWLKNVAKEPEGYETADLLRKSDVPNMKECCRKVYDALVDDREASGLVEEGQQIEVRCPECEKISVVS